MCDEAPPHTDLTDQFQTHFLSPRNNYRERNTAVGCGGMRWSDVREGKEAGGLPARPLPTLCSFLLAHLTVGLAAHLAPVCQASGSCPVCKLSQIRALEVAASWAEEALKWPLGLVPIAAICRVAHALLLKHVDKRSGQ